MANLASDRPPSDLGIIGGLLHPETDSIQYEKFIAQRGTGKLIKRDLLLENSLLWNPREASQFPIVAVRNHAE